MKRKQKKKHLSSWTMLTTVLFVWVFTLLMIARTMSGYLDSPVGSAPSECSKPFSGIDSVIPAYRFGCWLGK